MNHTTLLFKTSLQSTLRNPAHIAAFLLFSGCLCIMFPFAFGIELTRDAMVRSGVFWMIQEFSIALFLGQIFSNEVHSGLLNLLIAARVPKTSLLLGKIAYSSLFLFVMQIPMISIWCLFFNLSLEDATLVVPRLLLLCFIFNIGSSSVGSLLAAITYKAQSRDVIYPILFFPLQSALLTSAVMLTMRAFPQTTLVPFPEEGLWVLLTMFPIIFLALIFILDDSLF